MTRIDLVHNMYATMKSLYWNSLKTNPLPPHTALDGHVDFASRVGSPHTHNGLCTGTSYRFGLELY